MVEKNENPFATPSESIASRPKSGYTNDQPIRKLSALAAFVIAAVGGISSWHGSQLIGGNHFVYSPYWEYHALWMTMFATLLCVFDFKKVFFVWAGLYCGTYAAHFIFFPPDPLVPLGMIYGVAHTAFFSYVGMVLGICLDYLITAIWRARKSKHIQ